MHNTNKPILFISFVLSLFLFDCTYSSTNLEAMNAVLLNQPISLSDSDDDPLQINLTDTDPFEEKEMDSISTNEGSTPQGQYTPPSDPSLKPINLTRALTPIPPSLPPSTTAITVAEEDPIKQKVKDALAHIFRTQLTLRDKITLGGNFVLWASTYYFLQEGISKNWINDFFNTCYLSDEKCYMWAYYNLETTNMPDDIQNYFVKPNVGIAWSFYVLSRLLQMSELYLPTEKVISDVKKETHLKFKVLNGVSEAGVLTMGAILGGVPAFSFYNSYLLGNWTKERILPYVIPLASFLMFENILTFKLLKNSIVTSLILEQGDNDIQSLKMQMRQKLESSKKALFALDGETLLNFYETLKFEQDSLKQIKLFLNLKEESVESNASSFRHYTKIIASVIAFGATVYIAYLSSSNGLASLYDSVRDGFNFIGGISPHNQMQLKIAKEYIPPVGSCNTSSTQNWFNLFLNQIITNYVPLPTSESDTSSSSGSSYGSSSSGSSYASSSNESSYASSSTGLSYGSSSNGSATSSSGSFYASSSSDSSPYSPDDYGISIIGYGLPGIAPGTEFNIYPYWFFPNTTENCEEWLSGIMSGFEANAGTNSTDPIPASPKAQQFGSILGSFNGLFTAALTSLQTWRVVDGLFDLFNNTPKHPEAGKRSKVFNGINLTFSTFEAVFRTAPIAMINYFAMNGTVPDAIFWPLLMLNCFVTMCTYINYFFEHYQKMPSTAQWFWWYINYAKAHITKQPFVEPTIFYAKHDALQQMLDKASDTIAYANDDTIRLLSKELELSPKDLSEMAMPWYKKLLQKARRIGEGIA